MFYLFGHYTVYVGSTEFTAMREYKNLDEYAKYMNIYNTCWCTIYNNDESVNSSEIYTNAKVDEATPITQINQRSYDKGTTPPAWSVANLQLVDNQDRMYSLGFLSTVVDSTNVYIFRDREKAKEYLRIDDSEKDDFASRYAENYEQLIMGVTNWNLYVSNLTSVKGLKNYSKFTIRVDNDRITNDNLNEYVINVFGGFRYSDASARDNYIIKKIGEYDITNNLNITVLQIIEFVDNMPESKVYDVGDYWIGVSLIKGIKRTTIMGGEFNLNYKKIDISGIVPIAGNEDDGSSITFHWNESPTEDIDYSHNDDNFEDGSTDSLLYRVYDSGTHTYFCTQTNIINLINELWNGDFIERIKTLTLSPIESIISLKFLPFSLGSHDATITIGNYVSNISAKTGLPDTFKVKVGTLNLRYKYNNYLDLQPYTKVYLWLPYTGLVTINHNDLIGQSYDIYLYYALEGQGKYTIEKTGCIVNSFDCNIATEIPLSATDSAQTNLKRITSLNINTPLQAINNFLASPEHTGIKGNLSANVFSLMTHKIIVIYDRPQWQNNVGFNHSKGRVCNMTKSIGSLSGFTKCYNSIDLTGLSCDEEEKTMIEQILTSGFYV